MAPKDESYAPNNTPPAMVEDWGFAGHLTTEQAKRLEEFRVALRECGDEEGPIVAQWNDAQLLRFLRAREFTVKKAVKMVVDIMDWLRSDARYHKLNVESFPTVFGFQMTGLVRLAGKDKWGRPVIILSPGKFFPRKVADMMEILNFFLFYVQSLVQYTNKCGFTEFTAIGDMSGWSLSTNFSLPVSQMLAPVSYTHLTLPTIA